MKKVIYLLGILVLLSQHQRTEAQNTAKKKYLQIDRFVVHQRGWEVRVTFVVQKMKCKTLRASLSIRKHIGKGKSKASHTINNVVFYYDLNRRMFTREAFLLGKGVGVEVAYRYRSGWQVAVAIRNLTVLGKHWNKHHKLACNLPFLTMAAALAKKECIKGDDGRFTKKVCKIHFSKKKSIRKLFSQKRPSLRVRILYGPDIKWPYGVL